MSKLEEETALLLKDAGLFPFTRQHRFHPTRRWRFDFAWVDEKVALEVEGGVYKRGRHQRPKGFTGDCEKYTEAALLGWTVIRATAKHVHEGQAVEWVQRALGKERDDG